jgi:hypothetical protein
MQQAVHTASHLAQLEELVPSLPSDPVTAFRRPERRDLGKRHALVQRVQREFDEMPGTCLTLAQASRLFGLSPDVCRRILQELIAEGTLAQASDLRYRLTAL